MTTPKLGVPRLDLEACASTQLEVQRLAREGAPHGALVVARRQTAGKGRAGRSWLSEEGGLYFSFLLRPHLPPERMPRLTLLSGAAVVEALCELGAPAYAKWPNDVLVPAAPQGPLGGFRKVCGILVEGVLGPGGIEGAVVGIGLNLVRPAGGFPADIAPVAGALSDVGLELPSEDLLASLLEKLSLHLADPADDSAFARALDVLRVRSATLGREVEARDDGVRGRAEDLDEDGALLVRTAEGALVRVVAGDVWPRS